MARHDPERWFSQKEIAGLVGEPFNDIRDNQEFFRLAVSRALDMLKMAGSVEKSGAAYRYAPGIEVIDEDSAREAPTLH